MSAGEKLVFMVTRGPSEPELATIPFVMAAAALASDVAVAMVFQGDGVDVRELGGLLLVCSPCLKSRAITPDDLVAGTEIVAAGRFIVEITSATNALVY